MRCHANFLFKEAAYSWNPHFLLSETRFLHPIHYPLHTAFWEGVHWVRNWKALSPWLNAFQFLTQCRSFSERNKTSSWKQPVLVAVCKENDRWGSAIPFWGESFSETLQYFRRTRIYLFLRPKMWMRCRCR